jgi:hypothetical protein
LFAIKSSLSHNLTTVVVHMPHSHEAKCTP